MIVSFFRLQTLCQVTCAQSHGGNAKTAIMCAFSPASRNRPETISTFQFASRAKTIVNVAKCNKKKETAAMSAAYEEEILFGNYLILFILS